MTYNQYTLLDPLSVPTPNAEISLCQVNATFQTYVMKALKRGYMRKNCYDDYIQAMRELDIHKMLSHRHVIRLHEIIDDEGEDKVYLIVEYAEHGQILDYDQETGKFFKPDQEEDKPLTEE